MAGKTLEEAFIVPFGRVYVKGRPQPYLQGQKIPAGSVVNECSEDTVAKQLGLVREEKPKTKASTKGV
jgi:hypothetical protein